MTKRAAPELVLSYMDELIAEDTVKRFCSILDKIRLEKETKDKDSKMDGLEWRCRQVGPLKLRFTLGFNIWRPAPSEPPRFASRWGAAPRLIDVLLAQGAGSLM